MLTKADRNYLHQLAARLNNADIEEAGSILASHHTDVQASIAEQKQNAHRERVAHYRALDDEGKREYVLARQLAAATRRKEARESVRMLKEHIRKELGRITGELESVGLFPMFTHFHEVNDEGMEYLSATSCILLNDELEAAAKGLAFVSWKDNPSKATGRLLSLERAVKAFGLEATSDPICRMEAEEIAEVMREDRSASAWSNKSVYLPNQGEMDIYEWERLEEMRVRRIERDLAGESSSVSE